MSGHSKWSQIKRQKGAADVKRGAAFSKLSNAIIIAARSGGDPNANFSLKMAIEKARSENMPKETIERAIKRGTGEIGGAKIEEVLYEGLASGGVGILIETLTDNKNRTNSEIKNVLNKFGAKMTGSGGVAYQFRKMGKILVSSKTENRDELELMAIDAGAEDIDEQDEFLAIFTAPQSLEKVKKNLESQDIEIKDASLVFEPQSLVTVDKEKSEKIIELLEALESLDDVSAVFTNLDTSQIADLNE